MIEPIKIVLGVLVRAAMLWLCSALVTLGMTEEEQHKLMNPITLGAITTGLAVVFWSIAGRLISKLKQNVARLLPSGATQAEINAVTATQPISAILKTKPSPNAPEPLVPVAGMPAAKVVRVPRKKAATKTKRKNEPPA